MVFLNKQDLGFAIGIILLFVIVFIITCLCTNIAMKLDKRINGRSFTHFDSEVFGGNPDYMVWRPWRHHVIETAIVVTEQERNQNVRNYPQEERQLPQQQVEVKLPTYEEATKSQNSNSKPESQKDLPPSYSSIELSAK